MNGAFLNLMALPADYEQEAPNELQPMRERAAPPHNLEAEQFLLGAIFMENELIERVTSFLKAEHFYHPAHRVIYEVCQRRIEAGFLADPVVLKGHFEKEELLQDLGGESYLQLLAQSVPSLAHVLDYARAIFETYQRRGLVSIGEEIVARALDEDIDNATRAQIEEAEAALYGLAETGKYGGGFKSFSIASALAIESAEAAQRAGKGLSGVTTGLSDLNRRLGGLQRSDLIILAARPAMGKSSLAMNIAFSAARHYQEALEHTGKADEKNGAVVAFFSLEMSSEQLAQRIISGETNIPADKVRRGDIEIDDFDTLAREVQRLQNLPIHIDDQGGISIGALAARARRLKRSQGLGLIVVDYVQLLTGSSNRKNENRVQEISEITQGLKALAKELDVPILALAQLSRAVESRDDKRPVLSDLRESGSIEQDADIVMFIYREEYYLALKEPPEGNPEHSTWLAECEKARNKAEIIIAKQRHGPVGTVEVHFEGSQTKFSDLADDRYDEYLHD